MAGATCGSHDMIGCFAELNPRPILDRYSGPLCFWTDGNFKNTNKCMFTRKKKIKDHKTKMNDKTMKMFPPVRI